MMWHHNITSLTASSYVTSRCQIVTPRDSIRSSDVDFPTKSREEIPRIDCVMPPKLLPTIAPSLLHSTRHKNLGIKFASKFLLFLFDCLVSLIVLKNEIYSFLLHDLLYFWVVSPGFRKIIQISPVNRKHAVFLIFCSNSSTLEFWKLQSRRKS